MVWDSAQHTVDVTTYGVTTFDCVIRDQRETSLVCSFNVTGVILPSDDEYLMLTFHVTALEDPGIFSMHGPCLCCVQKSGENRCLVCPDLDGQ